LELALFQDKALLSDEAIEKEILRLQSLYPPGHKARLARSPGGHVAVLLIHTCSCVTTQHARTLSLSLAQQFVLKILGKLTTDMEALNAKVHFVEKLLPATPILIEVRVRARAVVQWCVCAHFKTQTSLFFRRRCLTNG
jgi:hypothetical protein